MRNMLVLAAHFSAGRTSSSSPPLSVGRTGPTALLAIPAVLMLFLTGCVTNKAALSASRANAIFIGQVKLGQTQAEVRAEMHKNPESTAVKTLADGTVEETWNYLTDYNNDTNTSIVFRGGQVAAISQTPWLGNGTFTTPAPR